VRYGLRSYNYENVRLETLFSLSATALPLPLILSEIIACMLFIILMLHAAYTSQWRSPRCEER
jgi:hypothetical protein